MADITDGTSNTLMVGEKHVIIGKFGTNGIPALRRVPFNVRILGQTSGGDAYWVGEGAPKPVKEGVSKDESEKFKKQLEDGGATVEVAAPLDGPPPLFARAGSGMFVDLARGGFRPDPLDPRLTERVTGVDQTGQPIETRVTVERAGGKTV